MYVALLIITLVAFTGLAWRNYKLALSLLPALLPAYLLRFSFGFFPTTWLEIAILVLISLWLWHERPTLRTFRAAFGKLWWPTVGFALAATLGIAVSADYLSALGVWKAYIIEPIFIFVILRSTFRSDDWVKTLRFLAISVIGISALAVLQRFSGLGIPAPWDIELRATSIFDFPNALGLFLAPLVVIFGLLGFNTRNRLFITAAALGFLAVIVAKTEAALVAIPVGIFVALILNKQISFKYKQILTALAALTVLAALTITPAREKLLLHDYSGLVRRAQWSETLKMLADRPVLGAGLSGYPTTLRAYHDATLYEIFQYPHNLILNVWSELGLLGLASFLGGALVCLRLIKNRTDNQIIAFAALTTMAVHGLVDVPYFKNDLAILTWFFIAMLISAPTLNLKRK